MKIIKLFFVLIIVGVYSCDKPNTIEVTRIIKNNTNHKITLIAFNEDSMVEDFVISPKDSVIAKETCDDGPILWNCPLTWTPDIDSVYVIFDDLKLITYCSQQTTECNVNDKNIIGFSFDRGKNNLGYIETSNKVFVFTITDKDYQYAKDIGG